MYHFPSEKDVGPIKRYLQSYREGVKMQSDLPQLDLMKFQQVAILLLIIVIV